MPALSDCIRVDQRGFFFFAENKIPMGSMFHTFRDSMLKHPKESVEITRIWTDHILGMDHIRYRQKYDGVPVEGAEFTEHGFNDFMVFSNGKLAHGFLHDCAGAISEQAAIAALLTQISGDFAWNDSIWEAELKTDLNDPTETYYPEGKMVWALDNFGDLSFFIPGSRFTLAWKFEVQTINPQKQFAYYVDAFTGAIFRKVALGYNDGPANLVGHGTQTIDTEWQGGFTQGYVLHANNITGRDITTKYPDFLLSWGLTPNIKDANDNWGNNDQRGTTAHWLACRSWDYFNDIHELASVDGNGRVLRVYADATDLAGYYEHKKKRDYLWYGTVGGLYFGVVDVIGHEFTHGVTKYSADLEYQNEPGALNESFSDIFGTVIEGFIEGGITDWLVAEDTGVPQRSLENPGLYGHPDTYLGLNWYPIPGCNPDSLATDGCGVHTNSGVQNHWFFLLSEGGTQNGVIVNGIGAESAALISYQSLSTILQSAWQYPDARISAITAATLLFGACSNEEIQTTNAWAAVGVGPISSCQQVQGSDEFRLAERLKLYPNPTTGKIRLLNHRNTADKIEILSYSGQIVKSFSSAS